MTSLTQRSSGLKQRKTTTTSHGAEANDNQDEFRERDDMEDHDSKETRLTLMEEVLLLGLKDREVCEIVENVS